jgi:hypothetical protein
MANDTDLVEIPNAIPKAYQGQLESELCSDRMSWTFHEEIAHSGTPFAQSFSGFSHTAYLLQDDGVVMTPMSSLLLPVLYVFCEKAGIEFRSLLRIRVGLFTRSPLDVPHHNPHVDFLQPHHTAVYYVNESDGDTVVFDQTSDAVSVDRAPLLANSGKFTELYRVPPKRGKMMAFDGRRYHASMHPLRASKRVAITFNWV